jgi:hypothetical protein
MPKPNPPPPLSIPEVLPFSLDDHQQRDLARVLGLKSLSSLISGDCGGDCMLQGH